jgi:hypothetical protein
VAELMHAARPVFLDLAGRKDLVDAAKDWHHRIEIHSAEVEDESAKVKIHSGEVERQIGETPLRPADALLIRPDAYVAWVATVDEPSESAAPALRRALSSWFGQP